METLLQVNIAVYLSVVLSFLLGSIPFGILFTRSKGIDIRKTGSMNIGATNVLRSAGKAPAVLTLLCDMLKGTVAVLICRAVLENFSTSSGTHESALLIEDLWLGIAGLAAVAGHMFSLFLSFRGGKGVATGFGVLAVYSPAAAGITLLVWLLVAFIFKYSSLAALVAISSMPLFLIFFHSSPIKIAVGTILAILVIYKHKSNIVNLMHGNESKIGGNE